MQIPQDSVCSLINAHVFTRVDGTKQLNMPFCSLVLFSLCLSSQLQAESPHSFYCLQRFLWYEATFYLTTPPLKGIFLFLNSKQASSDFLCACMYTWDPGDTFLLLKDQEQKEQTGTLLVVQWLRL